MIVFILIINYIDNVKITFKQLEIFVAIAKTENMTVAAEKLHLSQSACSMALSTLENQLEGSLFDRHGKKLILNERGKILFSKASNIITQIEECQHLLLDKNGRITLAGQLIIGASTTIGNYVLPKLIGHFVKKYSEAKVKLRVSDTNRVIEELLKFNIDIGIIEGVCYSDEINIIPWKSDELIIIASPSHPLNKLKKVSHQDLITSKWILREPGSGTRTKFEEALGKKLIPIFELDHTEAIKQAVMDDLGLSCLSKITVADSLKKKELVELKAPFLNLKRDFYILLHKEKYKTKLLEEFIKYIN